MPNRLANEASPYLQQHAHNPVDWYAWGQEALARAKRENKPILLSIGYSACHWCHVMERESFEDEAIAQKMNASFVCVKVDREERPDLDHIYQLAVQVLGQNGGWPLTVFLTPALKPFFGGTYFPPTDRHGMPSFPRVLDALAEAYRDKRVEIDAQAEELTAAIAKIGERARGANDAAKLGPDLLATIASALGRRFDEVNGGFGSRPKFPNPMLLALLLRHGVLEKNDRSMTCVRRALDAMRAGGIYDQLGGGFHRYSTDEHWLVPHFEKMLYDNALLLRLYVDAFRATKDARYEETARAIVRYVAREMTSVRGAFFATQDADSEGEEGRFFVWSKREIEEVLAHDDEARRVFMWSFGVTAAGNFEESKQNVLFESKDADHVAELLELPREDVLAARARAIATLVEVREKRVKPSRDEKVLASWNGLMIGAIAEAGAAFDDAEMIATARRAFAAIEEALVVDDATGTSLRVLRHVKDDVTKGPGFLDDYAFLADAAIDLYEVTGEPRYIERARAITEAMIDLFADEDGFFIAPKDGEVLIERSRDAYDQAIPSGNAIACQVLLRLGALVSEAFAERGTRLLERLASSAMAQPMGFGATIASLDRIVRGSVDVVIVGPRDDARTRALAREVLSGYVAPRTIAWVDFANEKSRAACTLLAEGKAAKSAPVAYVCRGRTCSLPVATPEELAALLA